MTFNILEVSGMIMKPFRLFSNYYLQESDELFCNMT